jgi:cephalosporin-C deacetylase-like acetyl esterase
MRFDLTLEELRSYQPVRDEATDFDSFWKQTLAKARDCPLDVTFEAVDYGLKTVEAFDVALLAAGLARYVAVFLEEIRYNPRAISKEGRHEQIAVRD